MKDAWALETIESSLQWRKLAEAPAEFGGRMMHSTVAVKDSQGDDWLWILGGLSKRKPEGYTDIWKFCPQKGNWMNVRIK